MVEMRGVPKAGGGLVLREGSENTEGLRLGEALVMLEVMNMVARSGGGGGGGSGVGMVGRISGEIASPEDVVLVELAVVVVVVEGVGGGRVRRSGGGRREGEKEALGGGGFPVAETGGRRGEVHSEWQWRVRREI